MSRRFRKPLEKKSVREAKRTEKRADKRAYGGQALISILNSRFLRARSRLQSTTACISAYSSVASATTSAGFSAWLISICRAVASRPRCSSTSRSICVTLICSGDWRMRPEAKRASCWPIMPARRARSISSRSMRRPARSILPVVASTVTRSSAADSGSPTSVPIWPMISRQWPSSGSNRGLSS